MSSTQSSQKSSFKTNMKDQVPKVMKSYAVYLFNCPGCNNSYTGKTKNNFCTRIDEPVCKDTKSAVYNYINHCSYL